MKKSILLFLAVGGLLAVGGSAIGLRWAANQKPDFYKTALAEAPPRAVRQEAAREFAEQTAQLVRDLQYSQTWEQEFTQAQVNGWLAEELPERYGDRIPRGVSDPRVQFVDGLVRIGFQLKSKRFEGIVSLDLRPSVPEPNRLAISVESLYAGLLPLAPVSFIDDVSKQLDKYEVEHEWQVADGHHVLLITVVPNRGDRPILEELVVDDETLRIAGHRELPATITMRSNADAPRRL
ncbi:MAG: hypothetical protein M3552_02115 [Planctomycetota bacterium]|nr:hypothetical protein [Planctomycetaceae bacterium]MDQ3329442.1 hypothetical protein [Planctomycetota bacterium]